MNRFMDTVLAYTVPVEGGRQVVALHADVVLSDAYTEMVGIVTPAFLRVLNAHATRQDDNADEIGVRIFASKVGKGGIDAGLMVPFNMWSEAVAWPSDDAHATDGAGSVSSARRYKFKEVLEKQTLDLMQQAIQALDYHLKVAHHRDDAKSVAAHAEQREDRVAREKPRSRRARSREQKPTERQLEVLRLFNECDGNASEVARRLNRDPSTVRQLLKAGRRNLGMSGAARPSKKSKRLTEDRRGQVIDPSNEDGS